MCLNLLRMLILFKYKRLLNVFPKLYILIMATKTSFYFAEVNFDVLSNVNL